jgi:hypothetical protein
MSQLDFDGFCKGIPFGSFDGLKFFCFSQSFKQTIICFILLQKHGLQNFYDFKHVLQDYWVCHGLGISPLFGKIFDFFSQLSFNDL